MVCAVVFSDLEMLVGFNHIVDDGKLPPGLLAKRREEYKREHPMRWILAHIVRQVVASKVNFRKMQIEQRAMSVGEDTSAPDLVSHGYASCVRVCVQQHRFKGLFRVDCWCDPRALGFLAVLWRLLYQPRLRIFLSIFASSCKDRCVLCDWRVCVRVAHRCPCRA